MKTDLAQLDAAIARSQKLVFGAITLALAMYLVWFWVLQRQPLSAQAGNWGEFGDFIGGLLNPLVAYAAFYWLTRSVRLQKEELFETRVALQASSDAQVKQADYARTSLRINALTALINSIMVEVQTQRMQLQFIVDQIATKNSISARLLDGAFKQGDDLQKHIAILDRQIGLPLAVECKERSRWLKRQNVKSAKRRD